jgi:hypothetical protein
MQTTPMRLSNTLSVVATLCIASLLLCFMGFYNKFPLLFFDTGTYLWSGFTNKVPGDRPIIYGLFARHVSLYVSLWLVIFVQGIILAAAVYFFMSLFLAGRRRMLAFFTYIILIAFFFGASINVSQLIPDVFTSVTILIVISLLFVESISVWHYALLFIVGSFSIATHNSHLLISAGIYCVYLARMVFMKETGWKAILAQKMKLIIPVLVAGMMLNNTVSLLLGQSFFPPSGSHVFLMGRLVQTGILEDYLNENCKKKEYKICAYKDIIPEDFIWDFQKSPLYQNGGWEGNKAEYGAVISDILSTPKYLLKLFIKSIESGFCQLYTFNMGDTPKLSNGDPAFEVVNYYFHDYVRDYHWSRQYRGELNYDLQNSLQKGLVAVSLLLLFFFYIHQKNESNRMKAVFSLILWGIFINAIVCGALSGVNDRYQSRVIWLLPLPLVIIFFQSVFITKIYNKIVHE